MFLADNPKKKLTMATNKKLPIRQLGANGPSVSTVGLGTMGMSPNLCKVRNPIN